MSHHIRVLRKYLSLLLCMVFCLALAAPAVPAVAQEIIREPVPPVRFDPTVSVERISITGAIEGPIAHIQVTQTVRNQSNRVSEGIMLFPIPEGATTSGFQMTTDRGLTVEGEVMHRQDARHIYEEYVRQVRDPAILEYMGVGVYKARVFPLTPYTEATIMLSYDLIVRGDNGLRRLQLPLRTFAGNGMSPSDVSVRLDFFAERDVRPLYSPTHELLIDRSSPGVAHVEVMPAPDRTQNRVEILYGSSTREIELDLISYQPAMEDGYFMMLVSPPISIDSEHVVAKDVVVVLDVSGSMEGEKLVQAKKAAAYVIDHLNPADRFNVLAFSTGVRFWDSWMRDADAGSVESAHSWLDRLSATGSTDINASLLEAVHLLEADRESSGRPAYVLFLTDGLPTQGETDPQRILANIVDEGRELSGLRLFTFGVGYDVNTDLLNELGRQVHGKSSYVTPGETIDGVIEQFYSTISSPVLTQVVLDFGPDVVVDDIYPSPLPDLFVGEQLIVLGRYHAGAVADVELRGQINGEMRTYRFANQRLAGRGGDPTIARLWAMRKVGRLLEQIRLYGPDPEIVDAVVDLSLRYGIMTPYTAYLVEEPEAVVRALPSDSDAQDDSVGVALDPRTRANSAAMDVAQEAAAAPASGAEAVMQSEERGKLQATNYDVGYQDVTYLHGKTFIRQDGRNYNLTTPVGESLWVDVEYQVEMEIEEVSVGSDRYFELAEEEQLYPWLSLSSELLLVLDEEHAVHFTARVNGSEENR